MTRKLATIQKISKLTEIEGADKIEVASILGWKVVVIKGEFKEQDLAVYVEIDSILPDKPEFEFMRQRKFRVRTIKLRGAISQGICFPLSILPEGTKIVNEAKIIEGADVTEILGIEQYIYQIPAQLQGMIKGTFPSFLPKTDEPRVNIIQDVLTRHKGTKCYITEKCDGCLNYRVKIQTDKGEIEIGKIVNQKMPVKILSYNHMTGRTEFKKILEYHKYEPKRIPYRIGVGHRGKGNRRKYITCTDNHRFYTDKGYIQAKELKKGDKVFHLCDRLSFEQEQIILGTLIGDGSIRMNGNCTFFCFSHSIKQKEYFEYKEALLGSIMIRQKSQRGGFEGSKINMRALSISNLSIKKLIEKCCLQKGKKKLTEKWINKLTPMALAFWYMDDGSLSFRDEKKQKPRITISTNAYSMREVKILREMLKNKYNIFSTIHNTKGYKGNVLQIGKEGSEIFSSLISPYVCKSMKYKLPKQYEDLPCIFENKKLNMNEGIIETKVLDIQKNKLSSAEKLYDKFVYDLTIEGNHNYFALNILTHNSSCTFYYRNDEFGVCSRNLELKESPENTIWKIARELRIEEKLRAKGKNIALQGEVIGNGIQKNPLRLPETKILFFNAFDIDNYKHFDFAEFKTLIEELGLESVPIINTDFALIDDIDELVKISISNSNINPKVYREGIVIRSLIEQFDMQMAQGFGNGRLSFKICNPEYLLKYDA